MDGECERMTEVKIRAINITHIFKGKGREIEALEDLNLAVNDGEFVTVIGPSGCGKTTLIKIFAGLTIPTQGKILLDGKEVKGPGADRGMVFQQDAVFPWMTVEQNVEFGPLMRGISREKRDEIVKDIVKLVGLDGFEKFYPKELSGGMRKRVDLARAYASDPEVMLMDEPFGMLDSQTRSKMQDELAKIWGKRKKTVIFITHDLEEAIYLADRVVVLTARPGKIKKFFKINFPRPRSLELTISEEFLNVKRTLWKILP